MLIPTAVHFRRRPTKRGREAGKALVVDTSEQEKEPGDTVKVKDAEQEESEVWLLRENTWSRKSARP